MSEYIADGTKPAPRLPDVTESKFKMTVEGVLRNLWTLMTRKLFDQLHDVENVVVFDNTTRSIYALYDSDVDSTMQKMVDAIEKVKKTTRVRRCYMRSDPLKETKYIHHY